MTSPPFSDEDLKKEFETKRELAELENIKEDMKRNREEFEYHIDKLTRLIG